MDTTELLNTLRHALGPAQVLTREGHPDALASYEQDWRRRVHGHALAVVRPGSPDEVAAVVRACAVAGVSLVPQGGNTGLVGGSTPDASGRQVVLHLGRLKTIRAIDADNLTVTVEAGCVLQTLQEAVAAQGLLFPLSLAAEGSCTVGGVLATNAGGTQVLRYGNARELCLGLEVVDAQGGVWHGLSGLRKDNTGYDLRQLFVGSEGTLGIITAATLKLYPQPTNRFTAWAGLPSLEAAVGLLGQAHRALGASLTGFEVMGAFALSLVARHMPALRVPFLGDRALPYAVLLESTGQEDEAAARAGFERLLEQALESGCIGDVLIAENLAQRRQLWHIRESIPLAQAEEGPNLKHDIALPISRIPAFVAHTDALLHQHFPGLRLVNFGHLGDGNLHYNVQAPATGGGTGDAARGLIEHEAAITHMVYEAVAQHGGSFSAEHGVGGFKVGELLRYEPPEALRMMRAIKNALDPAGTFNPGRVLAA